MDATYFRSKNTEAAMEAIESRPSWIDFMDKSGRTLLYYATALGSQEIAEFLCQKGADVNRGQVL